MLTSLLTLTMLAAGQTNGSYVPEFVSARPQDACPADHAENRKLVERFFTLPRYAQERTGSGVDGFDASQLQVLAEPTDDPICQRLEGMFGANGSDPKWQWAAYRVGTRILVAWRRIRPPSELWLGYTPLLVLDANLNQVGGYAM